MLLKIFVVKWMFVLMMTLLTERVSLGSDFTCTSCYCHVINSTYIADCRNRSLTTVPPDLPNNTNHLLLTNNSFSNLTNQTFRRFQNLSVVDISLNQIRSVGSGVLDGMELHKLDISNNNGLSFHYLGDLIAGITSLKVLVANHIVHQVALCVCISRHMLRGFKNISLEEVHIDSNRIEIFEPGAIRTLPQTIKKVSARDNRFTGGSYLNDLVYLINLETLDLGCFQRPRDLLTILPNMDMVLIQEVCNNNFNRSARIELPPKLTTLNMDYLQLKYDILEIDIGVNSLKNITLKGNVLGSWRKPRSYVGNITELVLSNNFCYDLKPGFFTDFFSLTFLDISRNDLSKSLANDKEGKIFEPLHQLKTLKMGLNSLWLLPEKIFKGLVKCESLDLSENTVFGSRIFFHIRHMTNLSYINLSYNHISYITPRFMDELDEVSRVSGNLTIDLTGNDLYCICENRYFLKWISSTHKYLKFKDLDQYSCIFDDQRVLYLNQTDLIFKILSKMCDNRIASRIGYLCAGLLFPVFFVVSFMYKYRWKLRYLYYVAKSSRRIDYDQDSFDYDAFMSYSEDAKLFVQETMRIKVEEEAGLKLCLHNRDFLPSLPIAEGIVTAVKTSRKTVLVLSPDFIQSYWCLYEMNMADMESEHTGRDVLLILMYKYIKYDNIPDKVMYQIKSHTYIEYPNDTDNSDEMEAFWETFKRAITCG